MSKANLDKGILYLCIHKRLHNLSRGKGLEMDKKELFSVLGVFYHIPKNLRFIVMKEMEQRNMIKITNKINNIKVKVLPLYCDPEENPQEFYRQLGLF